MLPTVFLVGFMGAGKTTLGKKLAPRLQLQFADLDAIVAERYGFAKVQLLIEQNGIDAFRKAESDTLRGMDCAGKLIATGGGTPCFNQNMNWMKERGTVVYVGVDEKTLINRLQQTDLTERPLLKGWSGEALHHVVRQMLGERLPCYASAHLTVNPLRQTVDEIAEVIHHYQWPS